MISPSLRADLLSACLLAACTLPLPLLAGGTHAGGHAPAHHHAAPHAHAAADHAIGEPGNPARVQRTLNVTMDDRMRFTPSHIRVQRGETVRFVVTNQGQVKHEMGLGTQQDLMEHLEVMKRFPDMEHDEPNKVTLSPGQQGEIVWRFTQAGTVHFACLMPGHYEAGMKGEVEVQGQ